MQDAFMRYYEVFVRNQMADISRCCCVSACICMQESRFKHMLVCACNSSVYGHIFLLLFFSSLFRQQELATQVFRWRQQRLVVLNAFNRLVK